MDSILNNILPQALMMGVDYDLFWTLNPKSLAPFIKAFELSQRNEDRLAWQSGQYIKLAIGSSMSNKVKYPKEPFMGWGENEKVVVEDTATRKMKKIKQTMMERMGILNSRFEQKSGE